MTVAVSQPTSTAEDSTERHVEDLERAAAQIQRWWRKYHHLMHQQATAEDEAAATARLERAAARIQRWWRKCHNFLTAVPRGGKNDVNIEIRLQKAAARIQRWWRGYHQREPVERVEVPTGIVSINVNDAEQHQPAVSAAVQPIPPAGEAEAAAARRIQRWWRNSPRPSRQNTPTMVDAPLEEVDEALESNVTPKLPEHVAGTADSAARRIQRWWRKFNYERLVVPTDELTSDLVKPKFCFSDPVDPSGSAPVDSELAAQRIQRWWRQRRDVRRA